MVKMKSYYDQDCFHLAPRSDNTKHCVLLRYGPLLPFGNNNSSVFKYRATSITGSTIGTPDYSLWSDKI